jgi:hypothetical protein
LAEKNLNVGKTEATIRQRMRVHLRMIRNYYPFKYNCESDIKHFNLIEHYYNSNFKFYIFQENYSLTELHLVEKYLINFVSDMNWSIINDYTPFLNKYDHYHYL